MLCFPKRLPRIGDDPVWNEFCCSNVLFIQFFVHARLDDQRGWLAFWELISERCAISGDVARCVSHLSGLADSARKERGATARRLLPTLKARTDGKDLGADLDKLSQMLANMQ